MPLLLLKLLLKMSVFPLFAAAESHLPKIWTEGPVGGSGWPQHYLLQHFFVKPPAPATGDGGPSPGRVWGSGEPPPQDHPGLGVWREWRGKVLPCWTICRRRSSPSGGSLEKKSPLTGVSPIKSHPVSRKLGGLLNWAPKNRISCCSRHFHAYLSSWLWVWMTVWN